MTRLDEPRASSALPVLDLLWPGGTRRLTRRPGRAPTLLVLPARRSPRMLVPTGVPGAEAMLWRHSTSRRQRLGQEVLARGIRTGVLPLLPLWRLEPSARATDGVAIEDHVRAHVPAAVSVGVLLGPPRANAKPVLRVFDRAGRTIAFGKVGHTPLSASLVRQETAVLLDLGRRAFDTLELPTVLHAGPWQGLEVLLISALGSSRKGAPSWDLPLGAMYELAEGDRCEPTTVGGSTYLRELGDRVAGLSAQRNAEGLVGMLADASRRAEGTELGFGRWHGDWAPWNMAVASPRIHLWDWERSRCDVPVGFDIVHFALQRQLSRVAIPSVDGAALLDVCSAAMGRWYPRREQVEATVLLYVVDVLARYLADAGDQPNQDLSGRLARITAIFSCLTDHRLEEPHADD